MAEQDHPERLNAVEAALGRLVPLPLQFQRDEFFFRAGQAAPIRPAAGSERTVAVARDGRRFWQAVAAVLVCVSVGLGTVMALRPDVEPRIVVLPAAADRQPAPKGLESPPRPVRAATEREVADAATAVPRRLGARQAAGVSGFAIWPDPDRDVHLALQLRDRLLNEEWDALSVTAPVPASAGHQPVARPRPYLELLREYRGT